MDKLEIYAIWDREAKHFDTPFFAVNNIFAKRRFALMINDNKVLKKWPQQFDLWYLGSVDVKNDPLSEIKKVLEQDIKFIASATNFIKDGNNEDSNGS